MYNITNTNISSSNNSNAVFPRVTMDQFIGQCTACGGAWTSMIMTGLRDVFPSVYEAMPDRSYSFNEVSFIAECLCVDTKPTMFDMEVDKHIELCSMEDGAANVIIYKGGMHFEYRQELAQEGMSLTVALLTWYRDNCGLSMEAMEAVLAKRRAESERQSLKNDFGYELGNVDSEWCKVNTEDWFRYDTRAMATSMINDVNCLAMAKDLGVRATAREYFYMEVLAKEHFAELLESYVYLDKQSLWSLMRCDVEFVERVMSCTTHECLEEEIVSWFLSFCGTSEAAEFELN